MIFVDTVIDSHKKQITQAHPRLFSAIKGEYQIKLI